MVTPLQLYFSYKAAFSNAQVSFEVALLQSNGSDMA